MNKTFTWVVFKEPRVYSPVVYDRLSTQFSKNCRPGAEPGGRTNKSMLEVLLKNKEYNISDLIKSQCLNKIKTELKKCIVLCANCHRKVHYYNLNIAA